MESWQSSLAELLTNYGWTCNPPIINRAPMVLPTGTYFRKVWSTGRVGKWHRAQQPGLPINGRLLQYCGCGVPVRAWHDPSIRTETAPDAPRETRCYYLR